MGKRVYTDIVSQIDKFYDLEKGVDIENPNGRIFLTDNASLSRKVLKHIVEERKTKDGLSSGQIAYLLEKAPNAISNPEIEFINKNPSYPESIVRGKYDKKTDQGIMVVLDKATGEVREIINLFGKEARKFFKLLGGTPTDSASGGAAPQ